ncbi:MAG TPA: DedA family protein [Capillimicrobium sp.]|jgi:membrane protein DedA with SNARE-associated domain
MLFASLDSIARDAVTSAGYGGLIGIMIIENLFPPIPSEIVLPLAGYEVSQGELNFILTVLAATLGALIGALIIYAVGRYGGRPAIERWGKWLRIGPEEVERSEQWFARWGDWVVLGARLVPGARSVVSVPAGMARMPLPRFVALTTLGSLVWNTILIGVGYQLGENWDEISGALGTTGKIVLIAAVLGIGGLLVGNWLRKRASSSPPAA